MDDTWFVLRRAPDWDAAGRFFLLKALEESAKPELLLTQEDVDWYLGAVRLVGVGDELQLKGAAVARVRVDSTRDGDSAGGDDETDASAVRAVVSNWTEARVRQRRVDAAVEVAAGGATARLTAAGGAGVDTPLARLKASLARVGLPLGSRVVFASVTVLCVAEEAPCIVAAEQVAFHAMLRRTADAKGLHATPLGPRLLLPAAAAAEAAPVIVPPPLCPVAAGDVLMIAAGAEVKPPWGGLPASVPYTVDARAAAVGIFTGFSVASVQNKSGERTVMLRWRRLCARQRAPGSFPAEVTLLRSELHQLFPKLAAGRDGWVAPCDEVWFRTLKLLRGGSAAESGVATAPRIDADCSRGAWFVQRETGLVVGAGDSSQQPPPVAAAFAFTVHKLGFSDGMVPTGREVGLRYLSHDFAVRTTVAELARMPRAAAFAGDVCDAARLGATVVFTRFRASGENDSGAGARRTLVAKNCELSAVLPPAPEAAPVLPGDDEEAAVVVPDDMELRAFLQQPSTDHVVKLTYLFLVTATVVATGSNTGERWYVLEVQPQQQQQQSTQPSPLFRFRLSEGVPGFSEDEPHLLKRVADAVDSPASLVTLSFRTLAVSSEDEAPAAVAECAMREVVVHNGVPEGVPDVYPVAPAGAATALPHAVAVCGMLAPPPDGDGADGGVVELGEACGLAFAALAQLLSVAGAARETGLAAMSDADFCHVCDCLVPVVRVVERLRAGGAAAARAAPRGAREALAKLAHVVYDAFQTCGGGEERTHRLHTLGNKGLRRLALSRGDGSGAGGGLSEAEVREEAWRQAKREGKRGKAAAWKEERDAREARNRARAQEVGMPFAPEQIRVTTKEAPDEFIEAFSRAKAEVEAGEGVLKKRYPGGDGGLGSKMDFMMRYKSTEEWDEAP